VFIQLGQKEQYIFQKKIYKVVLFFLDDRIKTKNILLNPWVFVAFE
jgi:hypothetical protein